MDEQQIKNAAREAAKNAEEGRGRYICARCKVPLEPKETHFSYLNHPFHADILTCPVCGNVMIDESLVKGKMKDVETMLEDK